MDTKDGINTTEFWGSFGASVINLIPAMTTTSIAVQVTAIVCTTVAWCAYILSRTFVKAA